MPRVAEIVLPHEWEPRPYQLPAWRYLEGGGKRACLVWHRRSGKDDFALHWAATAAMQRVGTYWHLLPQQNQARKSLWDAINPRTRRTRIDDAFPAAIRQRKREVDMLIEFANRSTWQAVGSDNFDALVGSPPVGIVFSEWALCNPRAWAFLRPILAENDGWAIFITTPRGRNHAARMLEQAKGWPDWFTSVLSAEQTGVFSAERLAQERRELEVEFGRDEGGPLFEQEYLCSFSAGLLGSIYGRAIERLEHQGALAPLPYEPRLPVHTAWDLGFGDATAVWFWQQSGREVWLIDYDEWTSTPLPAIWAAVAGRGYAFGEHLLPHDADHHELQTGRTRIKALRFAGAQQLRVVPRHEVADGINAGSLLLPRCRFDVRKCERGLDALRQYHRAWDKDAKMFAKQPVHDWSSHAADAFRTLAAGMREPQHLRPAYPGLEPRASVADVGYRMFGWGDEPPPHILLQLQHQLAVTGHAWGAVAALVGGNELRVWEYEARPKVIREIERRVSAFWKSIRENHPPPVDGSPSTAETLAAMYPAASAPMLDLRTDNLLPEACANLLRAKEDKAAAEREIARCDAIIREKAGSAEAVMVNGFTVKLPAVAGQPDRIITADMVGQTIKGRAGHRRLSVKRFGEGEAA